MLVNHPTGLEPNTHVTTVASKRPNAPGANRASAVKILVDDAFTVFGSEKSLTSMLLRRSIAITSSWGSDKWRRHVSELSARNRLYHDLLRDLYPRLDAISAQRVDEVLRGQLVQVSPRARIPCAIMLLYLEEQGDLHLKRSSRRAARHTE